MTEPATLRGRLTATLGAFAVGLWLALLQYAYYFMLEVRLSSRSTSFFIALFFWLLGFLVGLNLKSRRAFLALVVAAPLAYYLALVVLGAFPYRLRLLPLVGACIAVAGMLSGSYFPYAEARFARVKLLFFHENNGFLLGILLSLLGLVFAGRWMLLAAPALGGIPVIALLLLERRHAGEARA